MRLRLVTAMVVLGVVAGCGTTRWTDTARTATEQLLISDAMDRAVSRLDLRALAGRTVYLDATPLGQATDHLYLVSTLRQHMLASGCILKEKREEADYVVEARAGTIGTDKRELMFGVPSIYGGTKLAGDSLNLPLVNHGEDSSGEPSNLAVADEAFFKEPNPQVADQKDPNQADAQVAKQTPPANADPKAPNKPENPVAEQKSQPQGPPESAKDPAVVPAGHTSGPGRLPPGASPAAAPASPALGAADLVAPWPFEERPDRVPLRLVAPANAVPIPVDRRPPLGTTGQTGTPPAMPSLPLIDPSAVFDP
ncbi:MAG: hypothetical protein NTW96_25285 [Planctomycetia bacterium]|nr:hypothetical protein [Planctomycetia bacterium]